MDVAVKVGVRDAVGVLVDVRVGVMVGVAVGVRVGVTVRVDVIVGVGVRVAVGVRVGVNVGVNVGVGVPTELNSYAPIEQCVAPAPGRTKPRWSRPLTGGASQMLLSPASIAALPGCSAIVCVGPPLSASAASLGLPKSTAQVKSVSGHCRLPRPSVIRPWQFSPDVLFATIVFLRVTEPGALLAL